jgi:hypothetical protein
MIQPVVLMDSPSLLVMQVMRKWLYVARLQDEHNDEDDDQDECSETDADTHGYLPPWSEPTCEGG